MADNTHCGNLASSSINVKSVRGRRVYITSDELWEVAEWKTPGAVAS